MTTEQLLLFWRHAAFLKFVFQKCRILEILNFRPCSFVFTYPPHALWILIGQTFVIRFQIMTLYQRGWGGGGGGQILFGSDLLALSA